MRRMQDALAEPEIAPPPPPPRERAGRLVAVLVTHDRPQHLARSLTVLLASPPGHLDAVLVVDNASGPQTAAVLARLDDPRLTVLRLGENMGGAGGFEAGLRHAVQHLSPAWLLVLDDDSWPDPGALATFHALDLVGWDAVAAAVRHPDGTLCEMNRPILDPFRDPRLLLRTLVGGGREAFHLSARDFQGAGLRAIDGASFVGLFLSAGVVARHGYPDINQLSLTLPTGRSLALLGGNGAGKSTLLKLVAGTIRPDAGQIISDGSSPHDAAAGPTHWTCCPRPTVWQRRARPRLR
jgi:ABC-type multidrug transport system fused ATPase/permease subunit